MLEISRACIAIEKNGKILLLKRSVKDTAPGLWEFPGGRVEEGETLEQATIREAAEETGLDVRDIEYLSSHRRLAHSGEKMIDIAIFHTKKFSGKEQRCDDHDDMRWFDVECIEKLKKTDKISSEVLEFMKL